MRDDAHLHEHEHILFLHARAHSAFSSSWARRRAAGFLGLEPAIQLLQRSCRAILRDQVVRDSRQGPLQAQPEPHQLLLLLPRRGQQAQGHVPVLQQLEEGSMCVREMRPVSCSWLAGSRTFPRR